MNTKNLKVKCLKFFNIPSDGEQKFTKGKLYQVISVTKGNGKPHNNMQLKIATNYPGVIHHCWMPETMRSGDTSFAQCFELVVEEDVNAKRDDIGDAIQYSIQCGMMAGGPIFAAMRRGDYLGEGFVARCVLADLDTLISKPNPEEGGVDIVGNDGAFSISSNGVFEVKAEGNVTCQQVLEELRNVLRCPDGANIVTWAEILAAGYFGEKHRKGGAIEDAIHYKKNGAYSDETLAKILAAIVNDGTNC